MQKLKELIILSIIALFLTPATIALADNGGFSNSVQVLAYGYNSNGEHFTNYTEKYRPTATQTYAEGYGINTGMSYNPGQTASSSIRSPETVYHIHLHRGIDN